MSQPPRLKFFNELSAPPTYFVTFCVESRAPLLANHKTFSAIASVLKNLDSWHIWAGVIMPDHLHLLTSPLKASHTISAFSAAFKRRTRKLTHASWKWQPGCFDRLLRKTEFADQKWAYIRENPVRAGLSSTWESWPYRLDWTPLPR